MQAWPKWIEYFGNEWREKVQIQLIPVKSLIFLSNKVFLQSKNKEKQNKIRVLSRKEVKGKDQRKQQREKRYKETTSYLFYSISLFTNGFIIYPLSLRLHPSSLLFTF